MKPVMTLTLNPAVDQIIELDRLVVGSMNRARSSTPMTGGKGVNVARVLKAFDVPVLAAGFAAGAGGASVIRTLGAEGIPARFLEVPGEVRINLKMHDAASGKTTEINQPGFTVDEAVFGRLLAMLAPLVGEMSALVLTGSLPAGTPPDAYRRLGILARERGVPVFLDADGDNLRWGLSAYPFAVKPNRDELERHTGVRLGGDRDWLRGLRGLQTAGAERVAATMGPEGVMMLDGDTAWHAGGLRIQPACATGAGDAALAAMIWAWSRALPPRRTVALMSAAGGVTTSKPGVAFCTLEEALAASERIPVREVR